MIWTHRMSSILLKTFEGIKIPWHSITIHWMARRWISVSLMCVCLSVPFFTISSAVNPFSLYLSLETPLHSQDPVQAQPFHKVFPYYPTLCTGLTVPLGPPCRAIFHQSCAKSTSFTRPQVRWWLIHLRSPFASFVTTEAIMDRAVIKTHTHAHRKHLILFKM